MSQIFLGFQLIGKALVQDLSVWWFLAPIFILWIGMEIYLGQYKKEKIGWNSILANGISFSWVNIASFRVLFLEGSGVEDFPLRTIILGLLFIYGMFIIYAAFTHKLSQTFGLWLGGPTTIYFLSTVSVLWGQGLLDINKWVLLDFVVLYLIIKLIFWLIKRKLGVPGEVEAITKGESPLEDNN